ncbi:MAG: hypothetical protein AAB727_00390 [Patescibacteria group bacterium]
MTSGEINVLIKKLQDGSIAPEEIRELLRDVDDEFAELKKKDPQKYLTVLRELNILIGELNRAIRELQPKKSAEF